MMPVSFSLIKQIAFIHVMLKFACSLNWRLSIELLFNFENLLEKREASKNAHW